MNVIINEDLYDHDFFERWTYGFEELRERVQEYPPSKVSEITWVPEDQIIRAARLIANSKPAAMQWGLAVDLFMTPTAMACADVVLPAATYPEKDGLRLGDGLQRGEVINKVTAVGEAKSDAGINLMIGKRLNPEAWPWDNIEDMLSYVIESTGMTFPEMREKAPVYLPFEYKRYEKGLLRADGKPGFNTATGRIELWSTFYDACGLDPMPYFEEPDPGPGATPELMEEYPFVLTTGARRWSSFHSEHRQVKRLRRMDSWPYIEVHPETAEKLGVTDGEWVWVENPLGRAKRTIKITPIVDPRVVSCDHGWWLPERDPENLYDVFDENINNLVPMKCGKSGFGANYKTSICKIYKVKEGE